MVSFFGDYNTTETVVIPFNTFSSNDPSASVTVTDLVAGDVEIHKDGGATQRASDAGVTVTIDFDSVTGNHIVAIDLSDNTDAGFYANGSRYQVRVEGTTVDGATVNAWIGAFSVGCTLRPTTAGRTLDIETGGCAGIDWGNVANPTTAVDLSGTDIQTVDTCAAATVSAIGANVITAASINADAITEAKIADNALANEHFAAGALTATEITGAAGCAVSSIGNNVITTVSIADGAITEAKVADDVKVDVNTIKTQAVTCGAGVTINPSVGAATIVPTNTQFEARSLPSADYVVVGDTIAGVTTVTTTTDVTNLGGVAASTQIQNDVQAVVETNNLDHLLKTTTGVAADGDLSSHVVTGTVMAHVMASGADVTTAYNASTDSLEAIKVHADTIKAETAAIQVETTAIDTLIKAAGDGDLAAILADTNELQGDWVNGGRLDLILDIIAADTTTDIPALIAALENVSSADVTAACTTSLNSYDAPTDTEMVAAFTEIKGATWAAGTDTLEHIRNKQTDIETDTQDLQTQVGTAGDGLTAINLPNQTMDITGNITGNLSGSVGSVTGAVGSVTGNIGGNVAGSVASVTGAVGSVTGAVASVTAGVTLEDDAITSAKFDETTAYPVTSVMKSAGSTIVSGTVSHDNSAATTTVFYCDDITTAAADHYNGRIVIFTSGTLANQATDITDYEVSAGEGKFTVTALTSAPADNVTFVIV